MVYGAILGDIVGSPYEFRPMPKKTKDFPLFSRKSTYTDDTVMTLAVADAIVTVQEKNKAASPEEYAAMAIVKMRTWGNAYSGVGYGKQFRKWLEGKTDGAYDSYGNGSAMRTSAVGWLFDDLMTTRTMAAAIASVTHNHPEGVKGAEAVASVIFLARAENKEGLKKYIKGYIEKEFGYNLSETEEEIRERYEFNESCQETVPEAIMAFLFGNSTEEVIRIAVSFGGDTDTIGAIAGSMAEAYYGVPVELKREVEERLSGELKNLLDYVEKRPARKSETKDKTIAYYNTIIPVALVVIVMIILLRHSIPSDNYAISCLQRFFEPIIGR